MGISAGLISAGGALAGMFGGGGAGSVQLPPQFQMPNMGQAANNAFGQIGDLSQYTNLASGSLPYAQNIFQGTYNNPFAGGAQSGAGVTSGLGENAALGAYGAGANLTGAGMNMLPYASSIMNTAFDPEQTLYNRTLQQTTDQTRAGLEARGMDSTPYGAGIEGQALSNFNIDWQNQQLQRQATGAGAAGGLYGQAGQGINTGTGIMNAAPGQYLTSAAYPYSTSMGILGNQQTGLTNMLGAGQAGANIANTPIQDYMGYLSAGTAQQNANNNTAKLGLAQQQQQFMQNQQFGQALGGGLYGIGQGYGNPQRSPFASGVMSMFG